MNHDEWVEQVKVCEWLRQCHPDLPFYAINNERKCTPMQAERLRRSGRKSGIFDLFFPRGNKERSGLWIDMKTENGKPSVVQSYFAKEMRREGYDAEFAYGAEEAINLIALFYGLPR